MSMEIPIRRLVLNVILIMIITIFNETSPISSSSSSEKPLRNCSSSCGNFPNITFPFRLPNDPPNCGKQSFELSCENNSTTIRVDLRDYYVKAINYDNYTIRVASANVQQDNCASLPSIFKTGPFETDPFENRSVQNSERIMILSCKKPAVSPSYIDTAPCINSSSLSPKNKGNNYSYVVYANGFKFSDLEESCQVDNWAFVSSPPQGKKKITSCKDIHNELVYGFELSWVYAFADELACETCYVDETSNHVHCTSLLRSIDQSLLKTALHWFEETLEKIQIEKTCRNSSWKCLHIPELIVAAYHWTFGLLLEKMERKFGGPWYSVEMQSAVVLLTILTPRTIVGISFLIGLAIYKWRRRHLSIYKSIEEFLQSHNNLRCRFELILILRFFVQEGYMQWTVNEEQHQLLLNTSIWKYIVPQWYKKYPNHVMELDISATSPPIIIILCNDVEATIYLDVTIAVSESSEVVPVACISSVCYVNHPQNSHPLIVEASLRELEPSERTAGANC